MSRPTSQGGRQITVIGVMGYTALCGLCLGLFRQSANLTRGIHTLADAQLSSVLMLIATGLLFVAIGLPVAFVAGRTRDAGSISLGCFFVGLIAIPTLMVILQLLVGFGVLDLD